MSNDVINRSFAADFANIRIEKYRLSQEKMAEHLGISHTEVKHIEIGMIPGTKIFLPVCDQLGLHPMDYLYDVITTDNSKIRNGEKKHWKGTTT